MNTNLKIDLFLQDAFFFNEGKNSCLIKQSDRDTFGKALAAEFVKKPNRADEVIADFRARTKDILEFLAQYEPKENGKVKKITKKAFTKFWTLQDIYYRPHINVKYVTDYLPSDLLKNILPSLESARVAAEPVFKKTEEFMNHFSNQLSAELKIPAHLILCLTSEEFDSYLLDSKSEKLPAISVLETRYNKSSIISHEGNSKLYTSKDVEIVEKIVFVHSHSQAIKGVTAFPGVVQGVVRVVLDPHKAGTFNDGDILVAGMTRPEYLHLMHKAAGFITDAGGILSHAAIVARELKKPCIIGTKIATTTLKDGMVVKIDAINGLVHIIK